VKEHSNRSTSPSPASQFHGGRPAGRDTPPVATDLIASSSPRAATRSVDLLPVTTRRPAAGSGGTRAGGAWLGLAGRTVAAADGGAARSAGRDWRRGESESWRLFWVEGFVSGALGRVGGCAAV
jgi:hypothetical protein